MGMKLKICAVLIFMSLVLTPSAAQGIESGVAFTGTVYEEDMGSEQVEEINNLIARPLKLNYASRSRLLSSGIFTPYQIAALYDLSLIHI